MGFVAFGLWAGWLFCKFKQHLGDPYYEWDWDNFSVCVLWSAIIASIFALGGY